MKQLETLYNTLKKDRYDVPDYSKFEKAFNDENNRKALYSTLKNDGYDVPDYDKFINAALREVVESLPTDSGSNNVIQPVMAPVNIKMPENNLYKSTSNSSPLQGPQYKPTNNPLSFKPRTPVDVIESFSPQEKTEMLTENVLQRKRKDAESATEKANVPMGSWGAPSYSLGGIGVQKEANRQKYADPEKMIESTVDEIFPQIEGFIIDEIKAKNPKDRTEAENVYKEVSEKYANIIQDRIIKNYVDDNTPKSTSEYILGSAMRNNIASMLVNGLIRFSNSSSGMDGQLADQGYASYDANTWEGIGAGVATLAADAPVFALTGGLGSVASDGVVQMFGKPLAQKGLTAFGKKVATEAGKRSFTSTLGGRIAAGAISGGVNLGSYNLLNEGSRQYRNGDYDLENLAKRTGEGVFLGGATAPLGITGRYLTRNSNVATKVATDLGSFGLESGVFTLPSMMEKVDNGETIKLSDFGEEFAISAGTLGMMKLNHIGKLKSEIKSRYASPDVGSMKLTDLDREILSRNGCDVENLFKTDKLYSTDNYVVTSDGLTTAKPKTPSENVLEGMEALNNYENTMRSPKIPLSVKAKLAYLVEGRTASGVPVVYGSTIEERDGRHFVTSMDAEGRPIEIREYRTKEKANEAFDKLQGISEANSIEATEDICNEYAKKSALYKACLDSPNSAELYSEYMRINNVKEGKRNPDEQALYSEINIKAEKYFDKNSTYEEIISKVGKSTGVDIDKAINKHPADRTSKEQKAIDSYMQELRSKFLRPEKNEDRGVRLDAKLLNGAEVTIVSGEPIKDADGNLSNPHERIYVKDSNDKVSVVEAKEIASVTETPVATIEDIIKVYNYNKEDAEDARALPDYFYKKELDKLNNELSQSISYSHGIGERPGTFDYWKEKFSLTDPVEAKELDTPSVQEQMPEQAQTEDFMSSLPRTKEGNMDFDSFTPTQVFEYTRQTDGEETAVSDARDLRNDIDEQIKEIENDIPKSIGGKRIALREKLNVLKSQRREIESLLPEPNNDIILSSPDNTSISELPENKDEPLENNRGEISRKEQNLLNLPNHEQDGRTEISQPVPQGEYGKKNPENESVEEVTTELRRRVAEATGNAQTDSRTLSGRELEERVAESYAKEKGVWIPMENIFDLGDPIKGGNENDCYLNTETNEVYKVNNLMNSNGILSLFERIAIYNKLFNESKYTFLGLTGLDGRSIYPVFRQDYVPDATFATPEEISSYMKSLGFSPRGNFTYSNGTYEVSDLRPRNVLKDKDGDIYAIDAECKRVSNQENLSDKDNNPIETELNNIPIEDVLENNGALNEITKAEQEVNTDPSESQKEAGNYKMGHIKIDGFDITIENPQGSERKGIDANGTEWSIVMNNTYGYIKGTKGMDGDHIDVFLSDTPEKGNVYVIDQVNKDGSFDEHKVMYGFNSEGDARQAYLSNYEEGWSGLGAITGVSKDDFKEWIKSSKRKTKPFSEYKSVKEKNESPLTEDEQKEKRSKEILTESRIVEKPNESDMRFRVVNEYTPEESEIVSTAKEKGIYLKAPNGAVSNLNEHQWLQVRTKAFKEWFGDWEKPTRIEKLRQSKPIEITGDEIEPSEDLRQYKKNALNYGKNLRGEYVNRDTGENIFLTGGNKRGGIREILQHDYKNIDHLQSIAAIPKIIEDSIFVTELPNDDIENYQGVKSFRYYVCGLKINDIDYTVKAVVAVQNNGDRYYDHSLTMIEKGELLSKVPTIQKAGIDSDSPLSDIKDKRLLSILQTNFSKVLDVNGEPLVVYHGSRSSGFDVFEENNGIYFTDSTDVAKVYSNGFGVSPWGGMQEGMYRVYLNMYNPVIVDANGKDWDSLGFNLNGEVLNSAEEIAMYIRGNNLPNDGVIVKNVIDGDSGNQAGTNYVVLSSNQVKDAFANKGTFSPQEESILYRQDESVTNADIEGIESRLTELERKFGVPVERMNISDITDPAIKERAGRGAKAWYDINTGKVNIITDNIINTDDAAISYIHEVVAHKGLRDFLGAKRHSELMQAVYDGMDINTRIAYNRRYGNPQIAADEYIADVCEEMFNRRNSISGKLLNAWNRIVGIFRNFFRKLFNLKMNDTDIEYLLWQSAQHLRSNKKSVVYHAQNSVLKHEVESARNYRGSLTEKEIIDRDNTRFNKELQQQIAGTLPKGHIYKFGYPGSVLRSAGIPNLPIALSSTTLKKKSSSVYVNEHPFDFSEVFGLVEAIQNPIAVFDSTRFPDSKVILTELKHNGTNFVAALRINTRDSIRRIDINNIASLYPKDHVQGIIDWINGGTLMKWVDKEKALEWLTQQRTFITDLDNQKENLDNRSKGLTQQQSNSAEVESPIKNLDIATKIIERFENPKYDDNNLRFRDEKSKYVSKLRDDVEEMKQRLRGYKESVGQIASAMNNFISENMTPEMAKEMGKGELESLDSAIKKAVTKRELEPSMRRVEQIANAIEIRRGLKVLDKLIKLKVEGETPKGVAKAQYVDAYTKYIIKNIRGSLNEGFLKNLNMDIWRCRLNRRRLETKLQDKKKSGEDVSDIENEINALSGKIKSLKDQKEELSEQKRADGIEFANKRKGELEESIQDKLSKGQEPSIEEKAELASMPLVERLLGAKVSLNAIGDLKSDRLLKEQELRNNKHLLSDSEDVRENKRVVRRAIKLEIENLEQQRNSAEKEVIQVITDLNNELREIIDEGHSTFLDWSTSEIDRTNDLLKMAWGAVRNKPIKEDNVQEAKTLLNKAIDGIFFSPLKNMNFMLKFVEKSSSFTGEGNLYKYFMLSPDTGYMQAEAKLQNGEFVITEDITRAYNKYIGKDGLKTRATDKLKKKKKKIGKDAVKEITLTFRDDEGNIIKKDTRQFTKMQCAYTWGISRMADIPSRLESQGVDNNALEEMKNFMGAGHVNFAKWLQEYYLPKLYTERYNPTHERIFGTSLGFNPYYLPLIILKQDIPNNSDLGEWEQADMPTTVAGNIIKRTKNTLPIDLSADLLSVIGNYVKNMEKWNAFASITKDMQAVVNNNYFKKLLEANKRGLHEDFKNAMLIGLHLYRDKVAEKGLNQFLVGGSKLVAGGKITYRVGTAIKQFASLPAFFAYKASPKYWSYLIASIADFDKWKSTWKWCYENLPDFKSRWNAGAAGDILLKDKSFSAADKFISAGMVPNKLIDSIVCAIGAKAVYDYNVNRYSKIMSREEAENRAKLESQITYNESQQSSTSGFLNEMQASSSALYRLILHFTNSPTGYYNRAVEATIDLIRASKLINGGEKNSYVYKKFVDSANKALMYGFVLGALWSMLAKGVLGITYGMMSDDEDVPIYTDEQKNSILIDGSVSPITGTPIGPLVTSFVSGYDWDPVLLAEINSSKYNVSNILEDAKTEFSPEICLVLVKELLNYSGLNGSTFANIYLGAERMSRYGMDPITYSRLLNLSSIERKSFARDYYLNKCTNIKDFIDACANSENFLDAGIEPSFGDKLLSRKELPEGKMNKYVEAWYSKHIPEYATLKEAEKNHAKAIDDEINNRAKNELNGLKLDKYLERYGKIKSEVERRDSSYKQKNYGNEAKLKKLKDELIRVKQACKIGDFETADRIVKDLQNGGDGDIE